MAEEAGDGAVPTTNGRDSAPAKPKARGRRGDGSRYKEKSGLWAVAIELPPVKWKDDGSPIRNRKVVRFPTRAEADAALRDLREQKRKAGTLPGTSPTVEAWFTQWLDTHVTPRLRPRTADTYRTYVRQYIVPALGPRTRLAKLTPDSIRQIGTFIVGKGLSPTTSRNAYHYAAKALDVALREGVIHSNPARLIEPPRKGKTELDVFSLRDAARLLQYLATHPDQALWATYLLTGARRGEVAGLEVDRVGETLDLSWQLQRIVHAHGCGGTCGRTRAGNCPDRRLDLPADYEHRHVSGGLYLTRPKSSAGWRIVPLIEPLRSILLTYLASSPENPWGLVFSGVHQRWGTVIPPDPDRITHEWPILRDAVFGGRDVRLHDVRHTTVDLLYLAGVPEDVIQEIVGHSTRTMTRQYKSRSDPMRLAAGMTQLSELLTPPKAITAP